MSDSTHHQQLSKAKEVKESPCMRSLCLVMSGCSLVVTVEEDGHTHHYQQHYEVLDWRVALVTKQDSKNEDWDGLSRLAQHLKEGER